MKVKTTRKVMRGYGEVSLQHGQAKSKKDSQQQGSTGIHSPAEHQAHPAGLQALEALQRGELDGDPVNFLALRKSNFFAKDLRNQHR